MSTYDFVPREDLQIARRTALGLAERLAEAESLLRRAINPRVEWDGLADEIETFLAAEVNQ